MHRTQIMLEDAQYERLREQARITGSAIGELVRRAVDQVYGSLSTQDRLAALDESFGAANEDDFDGLGGSAYVESQRRGLDARLRDTVGR